MHKKLKSSWFGKSIECSNKKEWTIFVDSQADAMCLRLLVYDDDDSTVEDENSDDGDDVDDLKCWVSH